MTPLYLVTPIAARDIDSIWSYITQDNYAAAERVEEAIYAAFALLGENPRMGTKRRRDSMRFWPVSQFPNYIVVYIPDPAPIQIVAVVHGKRHIGRVLGSR